MNSHQQDPNDFTVEISFVEKALTSLLFVFIMGGAIYFLRHKALALEPATPLFNLFFALGLFGVIRMVRAVFQEKRRGLTIEGHQLRVETLFSKVQIPLEDLREATVSIRVPTVGLPGEVSFLWGQFRYRLPCTHPEELKKALASYGLRVLSVDTKDDQKLKDVVEKLEHKKASASLKQRAPTPILWAMIFWTLGIVGMWFLGNL